jgi:hypothetical protein
MKTRNIFTKLSIAMTLVALLTTGAVWEVRRVRASTPPDPDRSVGTVGITLGQTLRLNVVDLAIAADGQLPPDPCRVVLTFRDPNGRPFTDEKGNVIRRAIELQAGQSAFLDLNGDMFAGPGTTGDTKGPVRLQLRPFVRVLSEPSDSTSQIPPDPCRATMEVFDNASGRTSLFSAGFTPPDSNRTQ